MPIEYWIEKDRRRIRAVVSGDVKTEEILQTLKGSTEHSDFQPGFDILSDHTDVGEPLSTQQARLMSAYLMGIRKMMAHSRWAVVTRKPASFGMMRMLAVFLEEVPMTLRVFGTLVEAEEWLSQPKDKEVLKTSD